MTLFVLYLASVLAVAASQSPFTLEELFVDNTFSQDSFRGVWISDTEFSFTMPGESGVYVYNAATRQREELVNAELMSRLDTNNPILSADRQFILAPSEVEPVYRHSTTARYALYNIATDSTIEIAGHERLELCIFGGGHSLAYVLRNDLYYLPENSNNAIRLTFDGIEGVIYNGHADWVYEEDVFSSGQATWFSPGGSYLAFASFDDTDVGTYSYYYYVNNVESGDLYPAMKHLKYPKVGTTNPAVRLRVLALDGLAERPAGDYAWVELQAPAAVTADHVLGGVVWSSDAVVVVHWLNRRQNYSILRIYNIVTDTYVDDIRSEPDGWVPLAMPRFSSDGSFFMSLRWSQPQGDGIRWQHLFKSFISDGVVQSESITPGYHTVDTFLGMNEETEVFYYTRTEAGRPWRRQVYEYGAEETCVSCALSTPEGAPCTWAAAALSRGGAYAALTCGAADQPSVVDIYDTRAREVVERWVTNDVVRERLTEKVKPQTFIGTVTLENGVQAPYRMFLPPGLDMEDVDTKYPMIFYVYSGPNTNTVSESFSVGYHSYLTTNRSVIYMMADGRGSGRQGQDMLFALNNVLGTVEVEDHFVILKQVLERHQFVDPARVGIWGHSYGGYATLLTLINDNENLFKCGISTAPVTSWLYYNTMYTERYMGVPDDNEAGYREGDVTLRAEGLRGKELLLMHGNADDNVHYQNAAKLMTALQDLDIQFDQMSYPDEAHSLGFVHMHRYGAMDRFWNRCLSIE